MGDARDDGEPEASNTSWGRDFLTDATPPRLLDVQPRAKKSIDRSTPYPPTPVPFKVVNESHLKIIFFLATALVAVPTLNLRGVGEYMSQSNTFFCTGGSCMKL